MFEVEVFYSGIVDHGLDYLIRNLDKDWVMYFHEYAAIEKIRTFCFQFETQADAEKAWGLLRKLLAENSRPLIMSLYQVFPDEDYRREYIMEADKSLLTEH